jgi:hypothetical protein
VLQSQDQFYSFKDTPMGFTLVFCVRVEFDERILSLLREPGKHDCIVDATMEEFNPLELQKENDFLQPMALKFGYIFVYYYFKHALFILR